MTARAAWLVAVAVVGSGGTAARAQSALAYQPTVGRPIRTVTVRGETVTLFGFPAVPDGFTYEVERRAHGGYRVTGGGDGAWTVAVALDSVRERRRATGGAWRDVVEAARGTWRAGGGLDDRFRLTEVEPPDRALDAAALLGAGVFGTGFAFPAEPVSPGTTVPAAGVARIRVSVPAESGLPLAVTVWGGLDLVIDSVAARGADELTYLHFRGGAPPRVAAASGEGGGSATTVSGAFAGRLIWSRAWGAFVSGAVRFQVDGRTRVTDASGERAAAAHWDVTITHQVRP